MPAVVASWFGCGDNDGDNEADDACVPCKCVVFNNLGEFMSDDDGEHWEFGFSTICWNASKSSDSLSLNGNGSGGKICCVCAIL